RFGVPRPAAVRRAYLVAVVAVFALAPLALVAGVQKMHGPQAVSYFDNGVFIPAGARLELAAKRTRGGVQLTWSAGPTAGPTKAFYRIFRAQPTGRAPTPTEPGAELGLRCLPPSGGTPTSCLVEMQVVGTTGGREWVDHPPPGAWTYRIGVSANWRDDPSLG